MRTPVTKATYIKRKQDGRQNSSFCEVLKIIFTMPPKKKGKAKKGNGNNEGDEERAESKPTEREILLSQQ